MGIKRKSGEDHGSGMGTIGKTPRKSVGIRQGGDSFPAVERGSWARHADKEDVLAIIDNAPCSIVVQDKPLGKVLYINRKSTEYTGYTLPDVPTGREAAIRFSPDAKARRRMKKTFREGIAKGESFIGRDFVCKDGSAKTFEISLVVLRGGMAVSMWTDVTRRENAEAEVRERELRFRSLFLESAEAILLFDGEVVSDSNPAARRSLGFSSGEQAIGVTFSDISPDRQDGCRSSARKLKTLMALAQKKSQRFERTFIRRDGSTFPAEVTMTVVRLQGRPLFHVTFRDISAWKEAEEGLLTGKKELERRVKERTRELSALNRRLLKEIEARKEMERELKRSREELRHLSEHIQRARERERTDIAREVHDELGQSLSALKIDVVSLGDSMPQVYVALREEAKAIESRIDKAIKAVREICLELRPPVLDHFGLIAAVEWYLSDFTKRTGITCGVDIDRKLVVGDEGLALMLFRILQEAMTNILRHAAAKYVEVSLKADHGNLILRVRDDGKGISEEAVSHPRSFGIIGIQERVRFWGGKSQFQGSPGMGTTMTVSIPIDRPKQKSPRKRNPEEKVGAR